MIDEVICMLFGYKLLNKFSIFFIFIRESGQNVRCHKYGGPCIVCLYAHRVYSYTI